MVKRYASVVAMLVVVLTLVVCAAERAGARSVTQVSGAEELPEREVILDTALMASKDENERGGTLSAMLLDFQEEGETTFEGAATFSDGTIADVELRVTNLLTEEGADEGLRVGFDVELAVSDALQDARMLLPLAWTLRRVPPMSQPGSLIS